MCELRKEIRSGEKAIAGTETGEALGGLPLAGNSLKHHFVFFLFERAGGINKPAAGAQVLERLADERYLFGLKVG